MVSNPETLPAIQRLCLLSRDSAIHPLETLHFIQGLCHKSIWRRLYISIQRLYSFQRLDKSIQRLCIYSSRGSTFHPETLHIHPETLHRVVLMFFLREHSMAGVARLDNCMAAASGPRAQSWQGLPAEHATCLPWLQLSRDSASIHSETLQREPTCILYRPARGIQRPASGKLWPAVGWTATALCRRHSAATAAWHTANRIVVLLNAALGLPVWARRRRAIIVGGLGPAAMHC